MSAEILAPGIMKFDFPKKTAKSILESLDKITDDEWQKSVYYLEKNDHSHGPNRKSFSFPLDKMDSEIQNHILKNVEYALNMYKSIYGIQAENSEGFDILKYNVSDYFMPHYDANAKLYRTVSVLVYLNPGQYEGGETQFHNFKIKVNPQEPCILLFPSNYPYAHASLEIKSGVKYIAVGWFNDLPIGTKNNFFTNSESYTH